MPERDRSGEFRKLHVFLSKGLSKACIHKENKLKTRSMELDSIYIRGDWKVLESSRAVLVNVLEGKRRNWEIIERKRNE